MILCESSSLSLNNLGDDVLSNATRSLVFLRTIEKTIGQLCYDQRFYSMLAGYAKEAAAGLQKSPAKAPLDADGSVEAKLLEAQESLHRVYEKLKDCERSAGEDQRLTKDDGVADEFGRTADIVLEVHNAINDLRWALGEHDAKLMPHKKGLVFSSPEAIEAYLETL